MAEVVVVAVVVGVVGGGLPPLHLPPDLEAQVLLLLGMCPQILFPLVPAPLGTET